ncbi:hypothetical protein HPP92_025627 [Vanilla planifolia]|uniref:Homeobox domain-containing protein n=1 Tax=Vanilla planifolia TaxID=51239 RepID=A0A835U967_VANPL|nr:hypothetical protein HPP92_025627 [Vanilla planifolia]
MAQELGYSDFSAVGNAGMHGYDSHGQELYSLQSRMELLGLPAKIPFHQNPESPWVNTRQLQMDESMRCLFPVHDAHEQPQSQGLSLSLHNPEDLHRSLFLPRHTTSAATCQLQNLAFHGGNHNLKLYKYLIPAQELLGEFCDLGGLRSSTHKSRGPTGSGAAVNNMLQNLDILELQKRKAKLLGLLEEVDRRYKRYCEQMRAVVSSFEAVAGEGAAAVYLALASKAMSRHFRSLRDGIAGQIHAAKKAMGEKDPIAPGMSRGETPKLKLLDQCFRQQKAFQQGGGMLVEPHPWRPQRGLPERSVSILRAWLFEHFLHPYPSDVDKHILARQTGLSRSQVSNWFINARVRLWKPMIEEMYNEEIREHEAQLSGQKDHRNNPKSSHSSSSQEGAEEQKPLQAELLLSDPESLSSIINISHRANPRSFLDRDEAEMQRAENYGAVDLDFSSYNGCGSQSYSGNGVSLTLGLQHHDGGGGGFSRSANPQALFYSREHMEECQTGQFSILDGEVQNLPHRNLMGAQLLHDLAG